jgi:hypothetical protein
MGAMPRLCRGLFDHHKPSRHHCAVPRDEPICRQLAADARGFFLTTQRPVVRNVGAERELTLMRWGMPRPPRTGGPPVTNIRSTSSPHWRGLAKAGKPMPGPCKQFCRICAGAEPGDQKEGCRLVRAQ